MKRQIEVGAILVLIAWTVARFIPVAAGMKGYGVNPWLFLLLDVGTVWPYVKGWSGLIDCLSQENPSLQRTSLYGILTSVSFLLPYGYIYVAGGQELPVIAQLGVATVVIAMTIIAVRKFTNELRTR